MGNPFKGVGTGSTTPSNSQLDDPGHKPVPTGKTGNDKISRPSGGVEDPSKGEVSHNTFHPKKHGTK